MPHDITKIVSSYFAYLLAQWTIHAILFEAFIFGCVSIRAMELQTQVFWLLKFLFGAPVHM